MKETSVIIRTATVLDVSRIADIYNEAVLNTTASYDYEPETIEARTAWFEAHVQKQLPVFVAEDQSGNVMGWSSLSQFHVKVGYRFTVEDSVYVAAQCHRQGVGRLLLSSAIEAARHMEMHNVVGSMDSGNLASIRLHTAFGFERIGYFKEVGYKFNRWLDLIYMQLMLNSGK